MQVSGVGAIRDAVQGPDFRGQDQKAAAEAFEAAFLTEFLKSAGVGRVSESFGGGAGEDQFASFLRAEQAKAIVAGGGIGVAEMVLRSLEAKAGA